MVPRARRHPCHHLGLVACFGGEPGNGVHAAALAYRLMSQASQASQANMLNAEGDRLTRLFWEALENAKAQLGPAAYQAAWEEGQRMTVEQAVTLALESELSATAPDPTPSTGTA